MLEQLTIFGGTANPPLAEAIAAALGVPLGTRVIERFPDSELHVRLEETVRDHDVFVVQPTSPPVNEHLVELLILADACRRASAGRITAIVPYFGYARADKRYGFRESITARMVADLMQSVGIERVVTLDLHTPQMEGFFRVPVDSLSAIPILTEAVRDRLRGDTVHDALIVAPDAGRVKMATRYAHRLGLPVAVLHKQRESATETAVTHLVGEVRGRRCVITDDMISTGGTIAESARALCEAGAAPGILVAAPHGLLLDGAVEAMHEAGVSAVITTDTVLPHARRGSFTQVVSVAPVIATAIRRFMTDSSLSDLY